MINQTDIDAMLDSDVEQYIDSDCKSLSDSWKKVSELLDRAMPFRTVTLNQQQIDHLYPDQNVVTVRLTVDNTMTDSDVNEMVFNMRPKTLREVLDNAEEKFLD